MPGVMPRPATASFFSSTPETGESCVRVLLSWPLCPPPRSTLFPYTTLFRSPTAPTCRCERMASPSTRSGSMGTRSAVMRSEEHTSELQSRRDLVCRLLLEKKNPLREPREDLDEILTLHAGFHLPRRADAGGL